MAGESPRRRKNLSTKKAKYAAILMKSERRVKPDPERTAQRASAYARRQAAP